VRVLRGPGSVLEPELPATDLELGSSRSPLTRPRPLRRTRAFSRIAHRTPRNGASLNAPQGDADARAPEAAVPATTLGHPPRMGRSSGAVPAHRRPLRTPAAVREDLRDDATPHDRPTLRGAADRHPRLLRGRAEPVHARDERLGRR